MTTPENEKAPPAEAPLARPNHLSDNKDGSGASARQALPSHKNIDLDGHGWTAIVRYWSSDLDRLVREKSIKVAGWMRKGGRVVPLVVAGDCLRPIADAIADPNVTIELQRPVQSFIEMVERS